MLKALIFDVDGTLAETEDAHRRAFNETFAEARLNWRWSVAQYRRLLTTTGGKERMRRHRDETGATGPDDATIAALHARKTRRYAEIVAGGGLALRPGVAALITRARDAGLRLAVATTTNLPNVDALTLAVWGRPSGAVFDVVAAGDEVERKKPAPDIYLRALARLRLRPEDCLAFEDSRNGLIAARAAGIATAITPSLFTEGEDFTGADWILPDLIRLPEGIEARLAGAARAGAA
ncbi:HAD-IA family hydrolase [Frigidibacter sp. MR17.14]|uniref:HAD-IA family hydrolase n=1 Tax=Frigidibacter sp. MR17.14 TaxID=3126509 RepID=UPI003012F973